MMTRMDLSAARTAISAEPWTSVGIAFVTGACFALLEPRGRLARAVANTAGAIALAVVREAISQRVSAAWVAARAS